MRKKYLPFWVDWNITQRKWLKFTEVLWRVPIMGLLQQVWPLGRTSACFYNFSAGEWRGFPIGWPWALTDHVGLVLNASMMLALTRHTGEAFQLSEMPRKKTLFSFVLLVSLNNMVRSSMSLLDFKILKGFFMLCIIIHLKLLTPSIEISKINKILVL